MTNLNIMNMVDYKNIEAGVVAEVLGQVFATLTGRAVLARQGSISVENPKDMKRLMNLLLNAKAELLAKFFFRVDVALGKVIDDITQGVMK